MQLAFPTFHQLQASPQDPNCAQAHILMFYFYAKYSQSRWPCPLKLAQSSAELQVFWSVHLTWSLSLTLTSPWLFTHLGQRLLRRDFWTSRNSTPGNCRCLGSTPDPLDQKTWGWGPAIFTCHVLHVRGINTFVYYAFHWDAFQRGHSPVSLKLEFLITIILALKYQ